MTSADRKDGGSAFPQSLPSIPGMSLRDWFAGQALTSVYTAAIEAQKAGVKMPNANTEGFAAAAYEVADAMLTQRDKED